MRFILYIAFAVALWYLGKAVFRHYLSSQAEQKGGIERSESNDERSGAKSRSEATCKNARDVKYRDIE
ncbi:MAG: hypothetical protein J4G05_05655 [Chlorobi bacterium]|nr:hypothetical protein [Chlorobiota bacterium]